MFEYMARDEDPVFETLALFIYWLDKSIEALFGPVDEPA